jgi:hypothetical protein
MACTTCLACFISTVNGHSKNRENALEDVALVAGTQQNLRNLHSLDIYDKSGNLDIYGTKPGQRTLIVIELTDFRDIFLSLKSQWKYSLLLVTNKWHNKLECYFTVVWKV